MNYTTTARQFLENAGALFSDVDPKNLQYAHILYRRAADIFALPRNSEDLRPPVPTHKGTEDSVTNDCLARIAAEAFGGDAPKAFITATALNRAEDVIQAYTLIALAQIDHGNKRSALQTLEDAERMIVDPDYVKISELVPIQRPSRKIHLLQQVARLRHAIGDDRGAEQSILKALTTLKNAPPVQTF